MLLALCHLAIYGIVIFAVLGSFYWKFYYSEVEFLKEEMDEEINYIVQLDDPLRDSFSGLYYKLAWDRTMASENVLTLLTKMENKYFIDGDLIFGDPFTDPVEENFNNFLLNNSVILKDDFRWNQKIKGFGPAAHTFMFTSRPTPTGEHVIIVGRDIQQYVNLKKLISEVSVYLIGAALILAIVGAMISNRIVTRKLKRANQTSNDVMAYHKLTERVRIDGSNDAFDSLGNNINHMLDRIQKLIEQIREQSDVITHESLQPAKRLFNLLESIKTYQLRTSDDEQLKRSIDNAIEVNKSIISNFKTELEISRIAATPQEDTFKVFDLNELLDELVQFYGDVAEDESTITIKFQRGDFLLVSANPGLMHWTFKNLITNAIKHSPKNSVIEISSIKNANHAVVVVSDQGPGIPQEYHEKVLQRFYRMERDRTTRGSGLGLSIVDAVVKAHNAELEFFDNNPGLIARISGIMLADVSK